MNIDALIRPNIVALKPYSSARHEFTGHGEIFLDANENPYDTDVNRYPDPLQQELKQVISELKNIPVDQIFLGNGSDEAIDLILRIFCNPGQDEIMVLPPTYGMYQVSADIADVKVKKVRLTEDFQPDLESIRQSMGENTKVLFLCSPNNPSGNLIGIEKVKQILGFFKGIVVIDEAYIDFCPESTTMPMIGLYDRLIVLQTLSKAWGMAAIRLGMAFSSADIISYFNKVKAPYNINILTQRFALDRLNKRQAMRDQTSEILNEKHKLMTLLPSIPCVQKVYPSDANFLLIKVTQADRIYEALVVEGIVVRNRSKEPGCENALRITIGKPKENELLIQTLKSL
ncbi:MAG: histidinol-phosphate transaminase [Saprospiraceae bacterium]|nr:histidinol-phosphate transaminase [Saprospiraceae bacterium]MBK9931057.1 histidinol-phosphate transaminase [Saprospiraceae bacterium]